MQYETGMVIQSTGEQGPKPQKTCTEPDRRRGVSETKVSFTSNETSHLPLKGGNQGKGTEKIRQGKKEVLIPTYGDLSSKKTDKKFNEKKEVRKDAVEKMTKKHPLLINRSQ